MAACRWRAIRNNLLSQITLIFKKKKKKCFPTKYMSSCKQANSGASPGVCVLRLPCVGLRARARNTAHHRGRRLSSARDEVLISGVFHAPAEPIIAGLILSVTLTRRAPPQRPSPAVPIRASLRVEPKSVYSFGPPYTRLSRTHPRANTRRRCSNDPTPLSPHYCQRQRHIIFIYYFSSFAGRFI